MIKPAKLAGFYVFLVLTDFFLVLGLTLSPFLSPIPCFLQAIITYSCRMFCQDFSYPFVLSKTFTTGIAIIGHQVRGVIFVGSVFATEYPATRHTSSKEDFQGVVLGIHKSLLFAFIMLLAGWWYQWFGFREYLEYVIFEVAE